MRTKITLDRIHSTVMLLILLNGCSKPIDIILKNISTQTINEITLLWEDEHVKIGSLTNNTQTSQKIFPHSESSLTIQYRKKFGNLVTYVTDVYFEKDYSGALKITFLPDDKIEFSWIDENDSMVKN